MLLASPFTSLVKAAFPLVLERDQTFVGLRPDFLWCW